MREITDEERRRYSRHILLPGFGKEGQERVASSSVFVLGAGALGSIAAMYLAGAGAGRITVADFDTVDVSNLHRQIPFREEDLGEYKAGTLARRMRALNSSVEVVAVNEFVNRRKALELAASADFIVEGSDNPDTKYMIDSVARELDKPYVVAGVSGMRGQIMTHVPGSAFYSDIFPESAEEGGYTPCSAGGVLGPLPGIMGAMEAAEAVKYLAGTGTLLTDRLVVIDLAKGEFLSLPF